jgi:hypothetical protein
MDTLQQVYDLAAPHWAFFAWTVIAYVIGSFMRRHVFTRERAASSVSWSWGRRTLPLHPMAAGVLVGLAYQPAALDGRIPATLYFALAGALSPYVYDVVKCWAGKRGLTLPPEEP